MTKPVLLNLGCGFTKLDGHVNVDAFENCEPDVTHDLNQFPYPWNDESVDGIILSHTLEHLDDWWAAFCECARILKPGAEFVVRVPDESSTSALTYRDHNHVFSQHSFHGIHGRTGWGNNAWAELQNESVPLVLTQYNLVPFKQYYWMTHWPFRWLLMFCHAHLRNFIWEQRFVFLRVRKDAPVVQVEIGDGK